MPIDLSNIPDDSNIDLTGIPDAPKIDLTGIPDAKIPSPPPGLDENKAVNSLIMAHMFKADPAFVYDLYDTVMAELKKQAVGDETMRRVLATIQDKNVEMAKRRKSGASLADVAREAGKGLVERLLGIPEAVNTTMQYIGNKLSSDIVMKHIPLWSGDYTVADWGADLARMGKEGTDYWQEKAERFRQPSEFAGKNLWDDPELLKEPEWWAHNLAGMSVDLGASLLPATTTARIISQTGTALKWAPHIVKNAANLGAMLMGGLVGADLEATQTYKDVLDRTGSEEEAAIAAEGMFFSVFVLNAISTGKLLEQAAPGFVRKVMKHGLAGVVEGVTEGTEEPAEAMSKIMAKYLTGRTIPKNVKEIFIDSLKNALTVMPLAAITGAGASTTLGVTEKTEVEGEGAETAEEEGTFKLFEGNVPTKEDLAAGDYIDAKGNIRLSREKQEALIEQNLEGKQPTEYRTLLLTGGPPGAGKSTGMKVLKADESQYVVSNADIVKEQAGYEQYADAVHEESSEIAKEVADRAMENKQPLLYDSLLTNFKRANDLIQDVIEDNGYVDIVFTNIDYETSIVRSRVRYEKGETKRLVPEKVSLKGYNRSLPTFIELYKRYKNNPRFRFVLYDNNVDFEDPVQVFVHKNGKTSRKNEELFDKLMNIGYHSIEGGDKYERTNPDTEEDIRGKEEAIHSRVDRLLHGGHREPRRARQTAVRPAEVRKPQEPPETQRRIQEVKSPPTPPSKEVSTKPKTKIPTDEEIDAVFGDLEELRLSRASRSSDKGLDLGEETPSTDFADHVKGYLSMLSDMVQSGEPGRRIQVKDYDGTEEWIGFGSSYPDFMRGQGWTAKEVIAAIENALEGKRLGSKQESIVQAALEEAQRMFLDDIQSYGLDYEAAEASIDDAIDRLYEEPERRKAVKKHLEAVRKALRARQPKGRVKTRIREITGQTKVGDLIREEDALKAAMKKAAQAARKAMLEGRKEGVAIERARLRALEARRREKQRERAYIKKLARKISKPVGPSVDFHYREAIENLQADIDPSFRMPKTIESKARFKAFLESHPDIEIPVKWMKDLNKKPLNDYTIEDLERIAEEIDRLKNLGKLKRDMKLARDQHAFERDRGGVLGNILKNEPLDLEKKPVTAATTRKGRIGKAWRTARAYTLRPSRIFDMLDGFKNFKGKVHQVFYDRVNRAENETLRNQDKRLDRGAAKLKELDMTIADLSKTRTVENERFTVDEMIDVYVGFKNPRKKLAIMFGNNISEALGEKIIGALTDNEKALGDFIIAEYDENYTRLREAYIEFTNEAMGHEPNYTPMRRRGLDYKTLKAEIADELLHRAALKKGYVGRGFTIERMDIPKEFQKPIFLGAYSVWLEQVPKQERFINLGKTVKDLHAIAGDPMFQEAVKQRFGEEYLDVIKSYISRVADPSIYKSFNALENVSRSLRQNVAIVYLAYNLLTMGKQLPSLALYLPEAGPAHIISAALEFTAHPFKTIEFVKSRDPQMKHRSIERELEELKNLINKNRFDRAIKKVGEKGMAGIYAMDRIATTIGWMAVYNRNVNRVGEKTAIEMAQKATLRTQPAAAAKDLAQLYTTNEFLNWFTQFTNQLSQIYNIATHDIPGSVRRGEYYKAFLGTLGLAIVALVIWSISNKKLPEDDDDIKEAMKEQALNAIPLVGKEIVNSSTGWRGGSIPAFKVPEGIGKVMTSADADKKAKAIIEGVSISVGLPYTGAKRVVQAAGKRKPILLLGPPKKKKRKKKL